MRALCLKKEVTEGVLDVQGNIHEKKVAIYDA